MRRLPLVFKIYFLVMGVVRPASNILLLYSNPLDVVYKSYGLVGFTILIYQVILYPTLVIAVLHAGAQRYLLYVLLAVLVSESLMLITSILAPGLLVTGGYALFAIMNIVILILSIVAYLLSSRIA